MKKIIIGIFSILMIFTFFCGCTNEDTNSSTLKITLFKAEPNNINYGETANLIWTVENADTVTIDNGIGSISLTGTRVVQPLFTTTYILKASKSDNTVSVSTIVIVNS
jgi:hypothetical protein